MKPGRTTLWIVLGLALLLLWQFDSLSPARRGLASATLVLYALVLATALKRTGRRSPDTARRQDYWVAYATETGTARQLARHTCKRLRQAGFSAQPVALNRLSTIELPEQALLLVVSTSGNGDAPKTGVGWDSDNQAARFAGVPFAVLALGDRHYPRFCAFGLEVAQRLQAAGARPLFPPLLVSQASPDMINLWYRQLLSALPASSSSTDARSADPLRRR